MKITVIGTGYVGLVAGAGLADMGNEVVCVDNDTNKIEMLSSGKVPIFEPGLEELVNTNLLENRLKFSSDLISSVKASDVCFIAVGTPQNSDGSADLSSVYEVADAIVKGLDKYKVIVDKSTVPVGTANKLTEYIKQKTNIPFDIVSNPEFLKQGNAVDDFLSPDRVIIGSNSGKATQIMKEVYSPFFRTGNRVIIMDVESAEMTKYASNAFLATKISFMNELANLCEKVGADIEMVRTGMSTDSRIGNKFLFSGIGYGGSCFPKDIQALIKTGAENNCEMNILKATDNINKRQKSLFIKKIVNKLGDNLNGKTIAVWGLAFKPKTNDMREAPSITIINELIDKGAKIRAYDPKAIDTAKEIFKNQNIIFTENAYDTLTDANALLLLTEWNEFRHPDFEKMKNLLKTPLFFDGRNQFDPQTMKDKGFEYICIGRK